MSDYEQKVVRINDLAKGRVVPPWRYWLLYVITIAALVVARALPDGPWLLAAVVFGWGIAYFSLLGRYKMRTIS